MHSKKEQLYKIIRHEMAHYLTYIEHGGRLLPHGQEFKKTCDRLKWGEGISRATCCLENEGSLIENEKSSVLRRVQKLMALASSSNPHEAELAMIKSQQLLLKHNIESTYLADEEKIILKRIMKQKKDDAKMRSIAKILETFFVNVIYTRGGDCTYLEISGDAVNVEIAEYVAGFLQIELDKLWEQGRQMGRLKGLLAKNSFFIGIAKGYCNKIHALKRTYTNDVTNGLMVIEKQLIDAKTMVYKRLSSCKSGGGYCRSSSALGELLGGQMNINPGVGQSNKGRALLIDKSKTGTMTKV
jgi:hypothetical protein